MNVNEVYNTYLLKINKNDTNRNIKVAKGVFVKLYNEQAKIWLEGEIRKESKDYEKNRIAELLIFDTKLEVAKYSTNYTEFNLPFDYFDYASSYSVASRGECKNRVLYNWDFKVKNRNSLFTNDNFKPSFDYEETLINLSKSNLLVFKEDFSIDNVYLTYYREPVEIEMSGYTKEDGTLTTKDIDPDLSDIFVNEIIALTALETIRIFENPDGFQLAKDRLIK